MKAQCGAHLYSQHSDRGRRISGNESQDSQSYIIERSCLENNHEKWQK